MKRITLRIAVAVSTFLIGVSIWALSQCRLKPRVPYSETQVTLQQGSIAEGSAQRVNLCALVRDSYYYDGKTVRLEAFYIRGKHNVSLRESGCDVWVRPSCAARDQSCAEIWEAIGKTPLRYISSVGGGGIHRDHLKIEDWGGGVRIDVIGRYQADAIDPDVSQGGRHVHLFEIMQLKNTWRVPPK
jgi:hypothetical protein